MIEFKSYLYIPDNFTGVCKLLYNNSIRHLKNGLLCREDGPAIEYIGGGKEWFYKGEEYGRNDDFTIESWKEKVEYLKREEGLKIFK